MKGTLAEQKKATIYQYQLVRKIAVCKEFLWSYYIIAIILSVFQLGMYRIDGIIATGIGIVSTQLIHFIIIRLTLIRVDEPDNRRWGWKVIPPWIGYIPSISIRK